ncbi:hypothetical protein [Aeromonas caviae]|uniref:Secreted protein n=1 Tax=Aeromonas caviae TaxID=648 RepID=A0AAV4YRF4_AERCA|nr:hypothetical protein [Aeromonas caviae]GJA34483.1 hypothetical protein KAM341_41610 [Aeromonas caviae]GJA38902.1 hypothetical protein KAM342_41450 [Aeromonas caviae]GJA43431.1 hypothetical protein KAM343_42270 [Aeromonas caviae]GJA52388.1 hypothetical protein KAM347_41790 [Aeromonas caviae]GJA61199.1 hypothetical protein KAM350_41920 [Aeromonas caviae]
MKKSAFVLAALLAVSTNTMAAEEGVAAAGTTGTSTSVGAGQGGSTLC